MILYKVGKLEFYTSVHFTFPYFSLNVTSSSSLLLLAVHFIILSGKACIMASQMILRLSLDIYIYAIDQGHVLAVRGWAWQNYLDVGYHSDSLYDPAFWFARVGQPGVYIQEPPFPPEFGRPINR
ncbi:hypothetical protein KDAU_29310 [Dictyobacter aurantiacus]|uniref:Uncharacterized protein n=1 Tax=Dictyobacter aurantiacus TaxID=1936993 RepID=A0A401ZFG2_9CHLR|nr:hypothetical protein KDAU_29310 [Dictyobacter aurantiacus]